jgi:hypothetical protein
MATREIPRAEWTGFFDQFSRDHLDETATLEVIGQEVGDQIVADSQIFRGISADEKDKENRIAIMIGADEGTTHTIENPTLVSMKDAEGDVGPALEIRSDDGTTALLTFQKPVLPV